MNNLNIDYFVTVDIDGLYGKEKATKEKVECLKLFSNSFELYSLKRQEKHLNNIIAFIILELKYIKNIFFRLRLPNIIFCRSYIGIAPLIVSKIYKIKLIHEIHAEFFDEAKILYKNNVFKLLLAKLIHQIQLFVYKNSTGLIFNNELLEKHFKRNYKLKNRTITITNGCNTKTFFPSEMSNSKKELGLDNKKKYLLFIGRINIWHGIEKILSIFLKIKTDNISLIIVGDSHDKKYIQKLKNNYQNDNIIFVGKVDHSKALLYFNASELSLIPTNNVRVSPGSPLKLFDAIACGKPVAVQQNTTGYSDIVKRYKLGMTTDFNDPIKASDDISEFINNLSIKNYEANNRDVAENIFSWDKIIKRWIDFSVNI